MATLLVWLIALHSLAIGAVLVFAPAQGLAFGGFADAGPLFFARQGGAFHFVVALAYLLEWRRHHTVHLLLLAKTVGVLFLAGAWSFTTVPWAVPASLLAELAMLVAVMVVYRRSRSL